MKVLVTAASKHGSTEEIARAIGDVLEERGHQVDMAAAEDVGSLQGYGAVVLGSGVYAGHWLKPAMELVERSGEALREIPVWLFSSGPLGDPPKPEEDPVDVAQVVETTRAEAHRVFPGKLTKKDLGFGEKAIVTALRAPEGDFRDWEDIRAWAGEIADSLTQK